MNKILIIGQAPAFVEQKLPYDTTMLYSWLSEVGIASLEAQDIFDFEAIYNEFPGFDANGGHLKPTAEQMDKHWINVLETKVQLADKIWVLGNVARDYINTKEKTWSCDTRWLYTIHPSKRNWNLYVKNKEKIISGIKSLLK